MTDTGRHAYLIIAHNEFDLLEKQLTLLDHPRNDIYLHIDKKVKAFDFDHFKKLLKHSGCFFVQRTDVRWGDVSQVRCELILLEAAAKTGYQYYHLLSGVDLPLKPQSEIHRFFDRNNGREFVHFASDEAAKQKENRITHYHFTRWLGSRNKLLSYPANLTEMMMGAVQKMLSVRRKLGDNVQIRYGSQWFSITGDLAAYVLQKKEWILKTFRHTYCPDEHFLQTTVYHSPFRDALYQKTFDDDYRASVRLIDWNRGCPYTFREGDFQELITSDRMFARKFSARLDGAIVDKVFQHVLERS